MYRIDSASAVVRRLYGATPYAPDSTRGPDGNWRERGLCRKYDPDLWYPTEGGDSRPARRICNGDERKGIPACPVKQECLRDALENDDRHGVFGGLSSRQRQPLHNAYERSHNYQFACDKCPASFRNSQALNAHTARKHKEGVAA